MSNNFSNLHSYVCQRLLSLFETLAKKYHRLEKEVKIRESSIQIQKQLHGKMSTTVSHPNTSAEEKVSSSNNHITRHSLEEDKSEPSKHVESNGNDAVEKKDVIIDTNTIHEKPIKEDGSEDFAVNVDDDIATMVNGSYYELFR